MDEKIVSCLRIEHHSVLLSAFTVRLVNSVDYYFWVMFWFLNIVYLLTFIGFLYIARMLFRRYKLLGRVNPDNTEGVNSPAIKKWKQTQKSSMALFSAALSMLLLGSLGYILRFLGQILNQYSLELLYRKLFLDTGQVASVAMWLLIIFGIILDLKGTKMAEQIGIHWPTIFIKEWWTI